MPDRRTHDRSRPIAHPGDDDPFVDDPFADDRADGTFVDEPDLDPAEVLARLRPPPPRSWRDRVDDAMADPPALGRIAALAIGLVLVALVGWRLLTPPAGAPEDDLPVARPAAGDLAGAGTSASTVAPAGGGSATAPGTPPAPGAAGAAGAAGGEVVVHVVGAVATPGVRRLPVGARVVDAIDASGGATPDADLARVNLAAVLTDGQQVVVPRPGEVLAPVGSAAAGADGAATGVAGAPINVNTATAAELEELPGVGPATAEAIIAHRESVGPFSSVDDLLDVRGIGEAKLEQLRDRATV